MKTKKKSVKKPRKKFCIYEKYAETIFKLMDGDKKIDLKFCLYYLNKFQNSENPLINNSHNQLKYLLSANDLLKEPQINKK